MAAMAFYGFYTSLGGRPVFGSPVLEGELTLFVVQSNVLSAIEGDDSVERVLIETGLVRDHPTES